MNCYATTDVAKELRTISWPGGRYWVRQGAQGAAGTIYVSYQNSRTGIGFTVGVTNVGLRGTGGWHAAHWIHARSATNRWSPELLAPVEAMGETSRMADWPPLRAVLADVDYSLTLTWDDLDDLVGGLPRSAHEYSAFWKGARTGWPGYASSPSRSWTPTRSMGSRQRS
ncbi:DUF7662 domain-containing protein [Flexivirga caeni]|uniref:DUF7662 domain-containing protein n=1 Tax=Flexivirga caeni TaxID=2294115 RepID=A0A3M9LYS6_9MICO|nr:hypothetical protein [Flexivirga caeni]RNI18382.1 hypothetical protein EFY87_17650 [Flexivirga caeni]